MLCERLGATSGYSRKGIKNFKLWFDVNKLSLNLNKTKYLIFGNHKINIQLWVIIDNVKIERVYDNKFLGVIIDHQLC